MLFVLCWSLDWKMHGRGEMYKQALINKVMYE